MRQILGKVKFTVWFFFWQSLDYLNTRMGCNLTLSLFWKHSWQLPIDNLTSSKTCFVLVLFGWTPGEHDQNKRLQFVLGWNETQVACCQNKSVYWYYVHIINISSSCLLTVRCIFTNTFGRFVYICTQLFWTLVLVFETLV